MAYDAYGNWIDDGFGGAGDQLPIGATSDWTNNPDNTNGGNMDYGGGGGNPNDPYGDFPDLNQVLDQPGAGQGPGGFDPYNPDSGIYTDPTGNPFHFATGVDQGVPDEPYGPVDPYGGAYPPGGGGGGTNKVVDFLKKAGNVVGGNNNSSPRSDVLRGAGISALGDILKALFAKPLFQTRTGFTGAANPQSMMANQVGRLNGMDSFFKDRAQSGGVDLNQIGNIRAQNPMNGMANDDPIKKILEGLK